MVTRTATSGKSKSAKSTAASGGSDIRDEDDAVSQEAPLAAVIASPDLRKKELIELIAARTEVKRKFIKPVVEAMIEVLGETIADGRGMNLHPMGKLMHQRSKQTGNARITVAKIRQSLTPGGGAGESDKESIAEDAD